MLVLVGIIELFNVNIAVVVHARIEHNNTEHTAPNTCAHTCMYARAYTFTTQMPNPNETKEVKEGEIQM